MDLSIIIPSYNTVALLDRCLESVYKCLEKEKISAEVIVIDNASSDGTSEIMSKKYKRVHTVFNKENVGFGKANNIGINLATGSYILLLNSDIVCTNNALEKIFAFMKQHQQSFVGGKLINENETVQPSCGPFPTLPVVFMSLFVKGDKIGITRQSPDVTRSVDWASGACLGGKKEDFIKVGMFDEAIFMYMDEIDFLYRAAKGGYRTFFYPEAVFVHTGAASSGSRKEPVINIYRGLLYFYRKHRSIMEQKILIFLLVLKALAARSIGYISGNEHLVSTYEKALEYCRG